jgi:iron-sulfur cluster assembly accessory protein
MASNLVNGLFICSRCLGQASARASKRSTRLPRALAVFPRSAAVASPSFMQQHRYTTRTYLPRALYSTQTVSSTPSQPPPPPTPSSGTTTAILNPRLSEDGHALEMGITPRAAHRLSQIMTKDDNPSACLRITVESGGCHGFQYLMNLSDTSKLDAGEDGDTLFIYQKDGLSPVSEMGSGLPKVALDKPSLELLEGSKVDYTMELIGSQFKIVDNPRATSSCGCGTSFDIKAGDLNKSGAEPAW